MEEDKEFYFKINDSIWRIYEYDVETMKKEYNARHDEDAYYLFGLTRYPEHEIWLNKEVCMDQKMRTLKHELTHCYIWSYGMYYVPHYTEEMVCDLVSSINSFINLVLDMYLKYLKGSEEN